MVTLESRTSGVEWRKPEPADKAEWEWGMGGPCRTRQVRGGRSNERLGQGSAREHRGPGGPSWPRMWACRLLGAGTRYLPSHLANLHVYTVPAWGRVQSACMAPQPLCRYPGWPGRRELTGRKLRPGPTRPFPLFPSLPPGLLASWTLWFVRVARA